MKKGYNEQLNQIIRDSGLDIQMPGDSVVIHNILMDLFKSRCENKKTALWGAGRNNTENSHASIILKKYTTYIQTMSCLIDSLPDLWGKEFMGYSIISPDKIKESGIQLVIIASKVQADSIIKDLKKYAPECEYIDIYGELRQRGISVYHKFYEESNVYTVIHSIREKYKRADSAVARGQKLKELIGAYLSIRDLDYALTYAKEYVDKQYEQWDKIAEAIERIERLTDEIKEGNAKKKDDILIYFIDSLRSMDVFEKNNTGTYTAKMLSNYLNKSVVFPNAKSTAVTTYESLASVIKQKYPLEQNVYENNIMSDFDDFPLLPLAKEMGYDIHFYISWGNQIIRPCDDITYTKQVYMSEKLWTLACDMAENGNRTFNFIYFPYELHFPLICGYHEKEPEISGFVDVGVEDTGGFVPRQLEECKVYVDKVMGYYRDFFNDDILTVLFSDHSQVVYDAEEQKPFFMYYSNQERCVGVTFFIKGFGLKPEWDDRLVSLYDFNDILEQLMRERKLVLNEKEIVRYQYYPIHYKKLREIAYTEGYTDYIDGMNCFTSKEFLYVITATGKEEVYNLEDIKHDIMNSPVGRSFSDKIKSNYDISFPDFLKKK